MKDDLLREHSKKLKKEAAIKSALYGILAGAAALSVIGLFSWIFAFKEGLFVALAAFALVGTAVGLPLYFFAFKPKRKEIARRVDALGLDERVITMVELDGDSSELASLQRKDAERAISSSKGNAIKLALSLVLVCVTAAVFAVGIGTTTVDALYYAGAIESGIGIAEKNKKPELYTLSYEIGEGEGTIYRVDENKNFREMDPAEKVEAGGSGSIVYAYPARDWVFAEWSDGYPLPYRQFTEVDRDYAVFARFEKLDDPDDSEPERGDPAEGKGDGDDGSGQEGSGEPNPSPQPGQTGDGAGEAGRDSANNQIIDGSTYYGDEFDNAHDDAMGRVDSDGSLSDTQKDAISDYLDSIEKDGSGNDSDGGGGTGEN